MIGRLSDSKPALPDPRSYDRRWRLKGVPASGPSALIHASVVDQRRPHREVFWRVRKSDHDEVP
jgi:hypothetical protein